MRLFSELIVVSAAALFGVASAWDYSDNGQSWTQSDLGICAGGGKDNAFSKQSPIDLPAIAPPTDARRLFLKYPAVNTALHVYNNGHSVAFTLPEAYRGGFGFVPSATDLAGAGAAVYRLWQVSFHAPSEHTLAGRRMPLEMQMVHQRVTGEEELSVVSVLFEDSGAFPSPFLATLMGPQGLPSGTWEERAVSFAVAGSQAGFQALLKGSSFYGYEGSLTLPPCDTGVRHFVRQETVPASSAQLRAFSELLLELCPPRGNFRAEPVFSTAGRDLVLVGSVDTMGSDASSATAGASGGAAAVPSTAGTGAAAQQLIANNPDFQKLLPGDSRALRRAKAAYHQADLEVRAALHDRAIAKRALDDAQSVYASTAGPVSKIRMKWQVEAAEQTDAAALQRVGRAKRMRQEAMIDAYKAYKEENAPKSENAVHPDGLAKVQVTSPPPVEDGSDGKIATTMPAHTFGLEPTAQQSKEPLQYPEPRVVLPRGLAASPFVDAATAQTEVAIGSRPGQGELGGLSTHGDVKLAPNLQQYDGPVGSVPVPKRAGSLLSTATSRPGPRPGDLHRGSSLLSTATSGPRPGDLHPGRPLRKLLRARSARSLLEESAAPDATAS